jgi:predicted permease
MLSDLRHAFRSLLKTPGFTLVAVVTLALGLGVTTTVFSWIERVLLNPLPGVADAGRVVALETVTASGDHIDTSYPDFLDYRSQTAGVANLLVYKERPLNLGRGEHTERVWSEFVSGNFFTLLGVRPRLGRFFVQEDRADEPAAASVAVISERFWRRHFAADPGIVGRVIVLNQRSFTVIGVAPADFPGSLNGLVFDLWIPLHLHPLLTGSANWLEWRDDRALHTLARLAPGVTLDSARVSFDAIARQLAAAHPETNRGIGVTLLPVARSKDGAQSELALPLLILLGVCGLVLLIVCANISNLLFVRASARQREMCIRQALGAGWFRLVRQLFAESLLISAGGATLAVLLALWLIDLLRLFLPATDLPLATLGRLDGRVLAVSAVLAVGATLLAGLAPAFWAARSDLVNVLRGGRGAGVSPRAEFFRNTLVAAEVAVAFVTLACAGLALKSFVAARAARPGFDPDGVLLAAVKLDASGYGRDQGLAFIDRLQDRLDALPGVESAALAENVPLGLDRGSWEDIVIPGYTAAADENMKIYRNLVSPGYFALMRIPVQFGREFLASDDPKAPLAAIVNDTFARRFFGTADAVGRSFSMWGGSRTLRIVGVAADGKYHSLDENAQPYFYLALRQFYSPSTGLAVHVRVKSGDPMAQLAELRASVQAIDPNVPVFEAFSLQEFIEAARFAQRAAAELLSALATLAVGLAVLGLYGVLTFAVAQRTSEIGVRLALGALPGDIVRLVLRRGGVLVGAGLVVGLLAAAGTAHLLAHLLYGVRSSEPALLAAVAAIIGAAALLACWLPARRAARVDPMVALRTE